METVDPEDQVDTPCPINVFPSADSLCDITFHQTHAISH